MYVKGNKTLSCCAREGAFLKILIMGAGAIGSVFGGFLAKGGHDVTLIGRPWHMDAIQAKGLHISGIWGEHRVTNLLTRTTVPGEVAVTVYADRVVIGPMKGSRFPVRKTEEIAAVIHGSGIPCMAAPEIEQYIWGKVLYNAALNAPAAILEINYGKKTEIEALNGAIVRLGQKHAIPAPVNETLTRLIRFKEAGRKNADRVSNG